MSQDELTAAADLFRNAAVELEVAAAHCMTTADHFQNGEVPRAAAHAWAATGHVERATDAMLEQARIHATKAVP